MSEPYKYPGEELELFQHAVNWKKYFGQQIKPYIRGNVLEAGAGMGGTTLLLNEGLAPHWLLLEPDEHLSALLLKKMQEKKLPGNCALHTGTLESISVAYDTILYIDVLEHISTDNEELLKASALLNKGGHLIVLAPAFRFLYSPFDKAIGHYRRYNRKMFRGKDLPGLELVQNRYFDTLGFFAAIMNRWLLRQQYPTARQIQCWDKWLIPFSKISDPLFFHSFGKSIIAIWKKIK